MERWGHYSAKGGDGGGKPRELADMTLVGGKVGGSWGLMDMGGIWLHGLRGLGYPGYGSICMGIMGQVDTIPR